MKKKIIIVILILLIGLLGSYFVYNHFFDKNNNEPKEEEKTMKDITPLMYEVTKEGSNSKIYLFGSIHIADTDSYNFPQYLIDAYNNSDYVACELDVVEYMNNMDMEKQMEYSVYTDGSTIKEHLSDETYQLVLDFMKKNYNYSEEMVNVYNAATIENTITQYSLIKANLPISSGIDEYYLKKAKADKKEILELETMELQLNLLYNQSDEYYDYAIKRLLKDLDNAIEETKELINAWEKGDEESLIKYGIGTYENEEERRIVEPYTKALLFDRNIDMKNKLEEYFNSNKKVFFMVGAAHLVSDKGIAELLRNDGYTVLKVN